MLSVLMVTEVRSEPVTVRVYPVDVWRSEKVIPLSVRFSDKEHADRANGLVISGTLDWIREFLTESCNNSLVPVIARSPCSGIKRFLDQIECVLTVGNKTLELRALGRLRTAEELAARIHRDLTKGVALIWKPERGWVRIGMDYCLRNRDAIQFRAKKS